MKLSLTLPTCLLISFAALGYSFPVSHKSATEVMVAEILDCRFENALRLSDSIYLANDNDRIVAATLHLAALGMRDIDFDDTIDPSAFKRSFERAKTSIYEYEKERGVNSRSASLRGLAFGMAASYYLKNGTSTAVAGNGFDAIRFMREARELDTSNAEVCFFLGLYDYAGSYLKKRLSAFMFWYSGGSKATGVALLEAGAQGAVITKTACALALSDIYLLENQPRKSREIIYTLKKEFPKSRFVLWAEAKYYEDQKLFSQAASVYNKLANSYETERYDYGKYNGIVTRNKQAHAHKNAGETKNATDVCLLILKRYYNGSDIDSGSDKRIKTVVKDTEKLLKKINQIKIKSKSENQSLLRGGHGKQRRTAARKHTSQSQIKNQSQNHLRGGLHPPSLQPKNGQAVFCFPLPTLRGRSRPRNAPYKQAPHCGANTVKHQRIMFDDARRKSNKLNLDAAPFAAASYHTGVTGTGNVPVFISLF